MALASLNIISLYRVLSRDMIRSQQISIQRNLIPYSFNGVILYNELKKCLFKASVKDRGEGDVITK